jgi:hypothetical protein
MDDDRWRWLFWWQPPGLLHRVIVNLIAPRDEVLRGALWRSRGAWLVLRDATVLRANAAPLHIDGEVVIPRRNVAFIQVEP